MCLRHYSADLDRSVLHTLWNSSTPYFGLSDSERVATVKLGHWRVPDHCSGNALAAGLLRNALRADREFNDHLAASIRYCRSPCKDCQSRLGGCHGHLLVSAAAIQGGTPKSTRSHADLSANARLSCALSRQVRRKARIIDETDDRGAAMPYSSLTPSNGASSVLGRSCGACGAPRRARRRLPNWSESLFP